MTYVSEVLTDAPIVHYRLGEASGTTMVDSSGNARDGSYVGSPTFGVASLLTSDANTAITLNGTNYGETASNVAFQAATFTAEAWIKTSGGGAMSIIDRHTLASGSGFQFRLNNGALNLLLVNGNGLFGAQAMTSGTYNDNVKHHVVGTCDGTNLKLYVDGALVTTVANSNTQPVVGDGIRVGVNRSAQGSGTVAFFSGTVDEAAYYGSALSAARIAAHYAAAGGSASEPTTVVGVLVTETDTALPGTVSVPSPYFATVQTDSPSFFWTLDETTGDFLDAVNSGFTLPFIAGARGAAAVQPGGGVAVEAVSGTQPIGQRPAVVAAMSGPNFTVDMWVRVPTGPIRGALLSAGQNNGWAVGIGGTATFDQTGRYLGVLANYVGWAMSTYQLPDSGSAQVFHIAWTCVVGSWTLYVNGVQVATVSRGYNGASPFTTLGGIREDGANIRSILGGVAFDSVAFYPSALPAARILAHYDAAAGPTTVVGSLATEADTVPPGTVIAPTVVLGALAAEVDVAPTGTASVGAVVLGALAAEADSAPTGTVSFSTVVLGALAAEVDVAPTGTASVGAVVLGALAAEADSAPTGVVTVGAPGGGPTPSTGVGTVRWVFTDTLTSQSWTLPINPDSMSPLSSGQRQVRHGSGMLSDRRVRTLVGAPRAEEWSFSGPIRTREHYDTLTLWSRKPHAVRITDHLGRQIVVLFSSMEGADRRPNSRTPWRMRYMLKCYLLEVPS